MSFTYNNMELTTPEGRKSLSGLYTADRILLAVAHAKNIDGNQAAPAESYDEVTKATMDMRQIAVHRTRSVAKMLRTSLPEADPAGAAELFSEALRTKDSTYYLDLLGGVAIAEYTKSSDKRAYPLELMSAVAMAAISDLGVIGTHDSETRHSFLRCYQDASPVAPLAVAHLATAWSAAFNRHTPISGESFGRL